MREKLPPKLKRPNLFHYSHLLRTRLFALFQSNTKTTFLSTAPARCEQNKFENKRPGELFLLCRVSIRRSKFNCLLSSYFRFRSTCISQCLNKRPEGLLKVITTQYSQFFKLLLDSFRRVNRLALLTLKATHLHSPRANAYWQLAQTGGWIGNINHQRFGLLLSACSVLL